MRMKESLSIIASAYPAGRGIWPPTWPDKREEISVSLQNISMTKNISA